MTTDFADQARELFEYSRSLRRDLHTHPELAFQEFRTAGVVARELQNLGLEVTTGVAQTGVVALLEGVKPGPVLLLRFDMDALPIQEETGVDYCSNTPGIMHACGHDGHVAIGLTVARMLTSLRDTLPGTVKFIFQPAEEGMGGAEHMLAAGIMGNPSVDYTLSMHVWNDRPVGWVGVTPGPIMAGADMFEVKIDGRGGHGALPHETIDPVAAAAQIILGLQTIVSRNVSPFDTAVVSVGKVKAGDAFNVIPQFAEISGTFRTFDAKVRKKVINRFEEIVTHIAEGMGCKADIRIKMMTPSVVNDPSVTALVEKSIRESYPDLDIDKNYRTIVSEDMAFMMQKAPGCYLLIGSGNQNRELTIGHHHPKFNIDENVLPIGGAVIANACLEILKRGE
jgi:amidohydrolase